MSYQAVTEALQRGAEPSMLCRTCPWTRQCITPPEMTAADVQAKMDGVAAKAKDKNEDPTSNVMEALMTAVVFAGADTKAVVCPVFALRLREEAGKTIADGIRQTMQAWDDSRVAP